MPNINIPVSQELLDRLTEHAFHAKTTKADVVRELLATLSGETNTTNTANIANTANTAKPAKRVGFITADPEPVAKRQPNPEFQAALQAQLAKLKAQT